MRAKVLRLGLAVIGCASFLSLAFGADDSGSEQSRIAKGFQIAPVKLKLKGRNRALVGLLSGRSSRQTSPRTTRVSLPA